MNMPGYSAGASLYNRKGHHQSRTTRVGPRGQNEVLAQDFGRGWDAANYLKQHLGVGEVHCECIPNRNQGPQGAGCTTYCYWWPY